MSLFFWHEQWVEELCAESWRSELRLLSLLCISHFVSSLWWPIQVQQLSKMEVGWLAPERCLRRSDGWRGRRLQVLWRRHRPDPAEEDIPSPSSLRGKDPLSPRYRAFSAASTWAGSGQGSDKEGLYTLTLISWAPTSNCNCCDFLAICLFCVPPEDADS